jgi:hypothetical protein
MISAAMPIMFDSIGMSGIIERLAASFDLAQLPAAAKSP